MARLLDQTSGYFLGLPRLCGFTGTSFVLGVPSSGLERLWPGTLTGFVPGLAIVSSECLDASTLPAFQQSGNVGRVYKIGEFSVRPERLQAAIRFSNLSGLQSLLLGPPPVDLASVPAGH